MIKVILLLVFCVSIIQPTFADDEGTSSLITLTDKNWKRCLEGEWMVKFYAPWCYACKSAEAEYERLALESKKLEINVAKVDIVQEVGLSGRFFVTSLPTIYHVKDGQFRRYTDQRTKEAYMEYIIDQLWEETESIHWFRHPNSVIMTSVSCLFKMSMLVKVDYLQEVHQYLVDTLGLSQWVSLGVFVVFTVIAGIFFGMILVSLVELILPPKHNKSSKEDAKTKAVEKEMGKLNKHSVELVEDEGKKSEEESERVDSTTVEEIYGADGNDVREDAKEADEEVADDDSQNSTTSSQRSWEKISEKDVEVRKRHACDNDADVDGCKANGDGQEGTSIKTAQQDVTAQTAHTKTE